MIHHSRHVRRHRRPSLTVWLLLIAAGIAALGAATGGLAAIAGAGWAA